MKKNFKIQFENLRQIIKTNASAIKKLIVESGHLEEAINSLQNDNASKEVTESLTDTKTELNSSIKILAEQTQKLFQAYDKLIDEVLEK